MTGVASSADERRDPLPNSKPTCAPNSKPDLLLCDYFDFVCGTSTGAIIAACIAAGMSTDKIRKFYVDGGKQMFDKASLLKRLHYSYNNEPLAKKLQTEFSAALGDDTTLGSPGLRSVLMMVMERQHRFALAGEQQPLRQVQPARPQGLQPAAALWQLVRASTAAPTYFPPEVVTSARGRMPTTSCLWMAASPPTTTPPSWPSRWSPPRPTSSTGRPAPTSCSSSPPAPAARRPCAPGLKPADMWLLDAAKTVPGALMNAAAAGWDMACRVLGECRFGRPIDREVGDLVGDGTFSGAKQFATVRYDPDVSQPGLDALGLSDVKSADVQTLDSIEHIPEIRRVGEASARRYVDVKQQLRGFLLNPIGALP